MTAREYARAVVLVAAGAVAGSGGLAISQDAVPMIDVGVLETADVRRLEREVESFCGQARGVFAQVRRMRDQRAEVDITTDGSRYQVSLNTSAGPVMMSLPARGAGPGQPVP